MSTTKTMNVVVSTAIRFSSPESITAYKAIPWYDLPEEDMEYNEVTRYIVGYRNIILLGQNGRRLATFSRRKVRGLAVDGQPIVIHGDDFVRIGVEDPDAVEAIGDTGFDEAEEEAELENAGE